MRTIHRPVLPKVAQESRGEEISIVRREGDRDRAVIAGSRNVKISTNTDGIMALI